ncbi:hypothetical protein LINPERHAP1_LOCUS21916 [Linum perenne]
MKLVRGRQDGVNQSIASDDGATQVELARSQTYSYFFSDEARGEGFIASHPPRLIPRQRKRRRWRWLPLRKGSRPSVLNLRTSVKKMHCSPLSTCEGVFFAMRESIFSNNFLEALC